MGKWLVIVYCGNWLNSVLNGEGLGIVGCVWFWIIKIWILEEVVGFF